MTTKIIKNLKRLFNTYIYYKTDDETNFHDWISENITYNTGVFNTQDLGSPTTSNINSEADTNFKELLYNNYYDKTMEKKLFLKTITSNSSYNNGVYTFHENSIVTETEQEDSGNGDDKLKNFVKGWANSKHEKQEYWEDLFNTRSHYRNGMFCFDDVNEKYIQQTITGSCEYDIMTDNGLYKYTITIKASPFVQGQTFRFSPEYTVVGSVIRNNNYIVWITANTVINRPVTLYADVFLKDDLVYSGGSIVIDPVNQ